MKTIRNTFIVCLLFLAASPFAARAADEQKHFSPKGKPASTYTIEVQQKARETLPFSDRQDFVEAKKGFIAA